MRIALVHDCICNKGGAERVLLNMHKAFPGATIFTSVYDKKHTYPEFQDCIIETSWIQRITANENFFKKTFIIFGLWAMQRHDLSSYDIILMSSTNCAKYVKTNKNNFVINYCHSPFRLAWNPNSYTLYEKAKGLKKIVLNKVINLLKRIDYYYAQKTDKFIANSNITIDRIRKYYCIKDEIKIIKPSIDTSNFTVSTINDDYYLIVSRLEKYKKVDLVIKAFNKLGSNIKIVGHGTEEAELKKLANNNIEFIGRVNQNELNELYSKCKALIFPQYEDYGITPLEANASGRPVIAYGYGGIQSTMIPFNPEKPTPDFTAIFFHQQNIESLIDSIQLFEKLNIDSIFIRKHAEKFDDQIFIRKLRSFVNTEFERFKKNNFR